MSTAHAHAVVLTGIEGRIIRIEAVTGNGPAVLALTGLPATATRETTDRIRAAVINSQLPWPSGHITVTLSPASPPPRGASSDLGIAAAILAAAGTVPAASLGGIIFTAELGLNGQLRPVRGVLPMVAAASVAGFTTAVVPPGGLAEAALVPGIRVIAPADLTELAGWLRRAPDPGTATALTPAGPWSPEPARQPGSAGAGQRDLADIAGQPAARRAAEICAAGGHHLLLRGRPGAGAAMLAGRIPSIMPPLSEADALEVTAIHSAAGTLTPGSPLVTMPPFIAPHHTATMTAIAGGGSGIIGPGAVSLAHRGCLFLDAAPEFSADVLAALRQPLETGEVTIVRGGATTQFPARFTMVLAAGICPCGRRESASPRCDCTPLARRRYLSRLAGPLLDRVDLKVTLQQALPARLAADSTESGAVVAARVAAARDRAAWRLRGTPWRLNAEVPAAELRRGFFPEPGALAPLERAAGLGQVSARGAGRVIALSWTLADLAAADRPRPGDVQRALGLWLGVAP